MTHVTWATASGHLKERAGDGHASDPIHYVAQTRGPIVRIFWGEQLAGKMAVVTGICWPVPEEKEPDL